MEHKIIDELKSGDSLSLPVIMQTQVRRAVSACGGKDEENLMLSMKSTTAEFQEPPMSAGSHNREVKILKMRNFNSRK